MGWDQEHMKRHFVKFNTHSLCLNVKYIEIGSSKKMVTFGGNQETFKLELIGFADLLNIQHQGREEEFIITPRFCIEELGKYWCHLL